MFDNFLFHLFNFSFSEVEKKMIQAGHPYFRLLCFFLVLKNPRKNLAVHSVWNFKTDHYKLASQDGGSDVNNFGINFGSMTKVFHDKAFSRQTQEVR